MDVFIVSAIAVAVVAVLVFLVVLRSFHSVGPAEVGLVTKRVGARSEGDQLVALNGEAGYQADLLMPGLRFKLWPIFRVERYDWVQVPPGQIGLVIAQVGAALPTGAKSADHGRNSTSHAQDRRKMQNEKRNNVRYER